MSRIRVLIDGETLRLEEILQVAQGGADVELAPAALKRVRPDIVVILGGPEVSYETETQEIARLADHVITGEADLKFAEVCARLLERRSPDRPVSVRCWKQADQKIGAPAPPRSWRNAQRSSRSRPAQPAAIYDVQSVGASCE